MIIRLSLVIAALVLSDPAAAAKWLRAESDHYVVHAKLDESEIREVATTMENFERLLASQLPRQTRSGRKLQVFLDDSDHRISRVKVGVPAFFSTAYLGGDEHFILGAPDVRRLMDSSVTAAGLQSILTTNIAPQSHSEWQRFYKLSRETVNPMLIDPRFSGLLENYLAAYASGRSMAESIGEFGNLKELAERIQERREDDGATFRRIVLQAAPPPEIAVRPMEDDEIALIVLRFERLIGGHGDKPAKKLAKLAERFPDSAAVWYEYAAAEFARVQNSRFGGDPLFRGFGFASGVIVVTANPYSDAAAWRAVNRSLALQPGFSRALRLKAEILLGRLVRSGDVDDATGFENVRQMLAPLASEPGRHPLAATLLYQSFLEEGVVPPAEAFEMLGKAFVESPGVEEFRYAYAVALARNGETEIAEKLLTSLLNDPDYRVAAQRALDQVP